MVDWLGITPRKEWDLVNLSLSSDQLVDLLYGQVVRVNVYGNAGEPDLAIFIRKNKPPVSKYDRRRERLWLAANGRCCHEDCLFPGVPTHLVTPIRWECRQIKGGRNVWIMTRQGAQPPTPTSATIEHLQSRLHPLGRSNRLDRQGIAHKACNTAYGYREERALGMEALRQRSLWCLVCRERGGHHRMDCPNRREER